MVCLDWGWASGLQGSIGAGVLILPGSLGFFILVHGFSVWSASREAAGFQQRAAVWASHLGVWLHLVAGQLCAPLMMGVCCGVGYAVGIFCTAVQIAVFSQPSTRNSV